MGKIIPFHSGDVNVGHTLKQHIIKAAFKCPLETIPLSCPIFATLLFHVVCLFAAILCIWMCPVYVYGPSIAVVFICFHVRSKVTALSVDFFPALFLYVLSSRRHVVEENVSFNMHCVLATKQP